MSTLIAEAEVKGSQVKWPQIPHIWEIRLREGKVLGFR